MDSQTDITLMLLAINEYIYSCQATFFKRTQGIAAGDLSSESLDFNGRYYEAEGTKLWSLQDKVSSFPI